MKQIVPNGYTDFHCIADRCRHSCCIGWEIGIDTDTLSFYKSIQGDFGKRLAESIETDTASTRFRLGERERCPFLNEKNLCDIILTLGENALCQICRDHPRFRNEFSDRTETGLGLCCEAAGAQILGMQEKMRLITLADDGADSPPTGEERSFFALRRKLFLILQNREEEIEARLSKVLSYFDTALPQKSPAQWADIFLSLERLDNAWDAALKTLRDASPNADASPLPREYDAMFEQLAVYFIYRHLAGALEDGRFSERAAFSVLGVKVVRMLCAVYYEKQNTLPLSAVVEFARLYSSEIEYSEENTQALLDLL